MLGEVMASEYEYIDEYINPDLDALLLQASQQFESSMQLLSVKMS